MVIGGKCCEIKNSGLSVFFTKLGGFIFYVLQFLVDVLCGLSLSKLAFDKEKGKQEEFAMSFD